MKFSVALVEDNNVNRNTFLQKISVLTSISLTFTAESGDDCLEQLKGLPHHLLPQVIFMDLEMPGIDGIETIRMAKSLYSHIHFIVLTIFDDDEKIFDAIKAGASGYILKHEPANVLEEAVINVIDFGGAPMSPAIARKSLKLLSNSHMVDEKIEVHHFPEVITEREQEILTYMINGWDAKRIAVQLNISSLTIRKHIANIYGKLHVNSRAQVINMAHKNNWI